MSFILKNHKTTIAGGVGWLGTLMMLVHCFSGTHLDLMCLFNVIIGGGASTGLMLAKDFNTTGGSVPLTKEAETRVTGHKSDPSTK